MKISRLRFNLISLLCIIAINAAFAIEFQQQNASGPLPIIASNLLFLALFAAARRIILRRDHQFLSLQRRYERLQIISEDREVEERILEILSEVSEEFLEKMQLGPLLDRMSHAVHEILHVDVSVIEVHAEPGDEGMRLLHGISDIFFSPGFYADVNSGKSLLVNNLQDNEHEEPLRRQGVASMLVAPMRLHERTIGLIGAFSKTERAFTGRELRQLHNFANHAALLVETTQLLHSVRRLSVKGATGTISSLRHLKEHLSYERQLSEREMEVARKIQSDLLPGVIPRIRHLTLEGESMPAKEVGGDYYDIIDLGGGRWGIAIADVSGKGVPAALVMVMTRTLLRALARQSASPAAVLAAINTDLYNETDPAVFVSMLYGVWDPQSRTFTYSNAGHEPPILVRGSEAQFLQCGGVALGVMQQVSDILEDTRLTLGAQDSLFLYTDGATEARNAQGMMFGTDRLCEAMKLAARSGGGRSVPIVLKTLGKFVGPATQHDDITMVCLSAAQEEVIASGKVRPE